MSNAVGHLSGQASTVGHLSGQASTVGHLSGQAGTAVQERAEGGLAGPEAPARRLDWTLIVAPAVTLGVTIWGIGASAYWDDEADTVSAVSRSVPQLFRMLGHVDAVHGLYYLLMWPVTAVAGTGEFATRFPSALAMAAAALGITAIGRRLVSRRAGLCAGLIFAILPTVSQQGQDARPYAMVTAAAVLASYLFIRTIQDPRPRWFTCYGLSLVLVGYMQMFGLLLVIAHVVTLIGLSWQRRRVSLRPGRQSRRVSLRPGKQSRWLVTFAAVGVAVTPLVIISWAQRWSIAWITRPDLQVVIDAIKLLTTASPVSALSVVSVVVLAGLGALAVADCRGRPAAWLLARDGTTADAGRVIGWLAVPWLVLPPAILLAVSEIMPVYNARYITFCLPAVALLAGSGIAALRQPVRAVALAVVLALAAPGQFALRVPQSGMLVASEFLNAHEKPGDAIVYPYGMVQPWSLAYPEGFAPLHDLSLASPGAVAGTLYGRPVSRAVLDHREQGVHRIWIVQQEPAKNPAPYLIPAFHLAHVWTLAGGLRVWLYIRGS